MRIVALTVLTLALACSGSSDPVEVTPEPPAPAPTAPPAADEPTNAETPRAEDSPVAEAAPVPEPPREGVVQVVDLPDEVPALPSFETRRRMARIPEDGWGEDGFYPIITTPTTSGGAAEGAESDESGADPAAEESGATEASRVATIDAGLRTQINAKMRRLAMANPEYPARCYSSLMAPELLSLRCERMEVYERGGAELYTDIRNFAITEEGLQEFETIDVVIPTANLLAEARRACASRLRREGEAESVDEACREPLAYPNGGLRIGPHGLIGKAYYGAWGEGTAVAYSIPWSRLDRAIYADTALGRMLANVPGASVAEVELPPGTVRAGETVKGTAFASTSAPAREALGKWLQLPANARTGVVLASTGGSHGSFRIAVPEGETELLANVRSALGEEGEAWSWGTQLTPSVVHTRVESNFRNRPGADRRLVIPPGTILGVALGRYGHHESAIGARGSWAITATAPGVSGFTAGALLEPHEGCEPDPAPFLEALPEGQRATAARTMIRSLVTLRQGAERREAIAFGAGRRSSNRRRTGLSRIEILERGAECAPGRLLGRHDLEGDLFAMRFVNTTAHGGKSLLLAGLYAPRQRMRWELYELGGEEPLWRFEARSIHDDVRTEVRIDDEYTLVAIERNDEVIHTVRWVDGEIVSSE